MQKAVRNIQYIKKMKNCNMPELSKNLYKKIKLVRRDMGNLVFHFTRAPEEKFIQTTKTMSSASSAHAILQKILYGSKLKGTSKWTDGENCVCFTEAPIVEFNSIFSLVELAASKHEKPRYEPYGIAFAKEWLFNQGGRPVIYDHPSMKNSYPQNLKYRFVPYDPSNGIDYTWEREWRIKTDFLKLDPRYTLVVVPTSEEAFDIVYEFADIEADYDYEDGESFISGAYHKPKWLAVSLDLFGFQY